MAPDPTIKVRPTRVTLLCLCCGATMTAPPDLAGVWSQAHLQPMLVGLNLVVAGKPERWEAPRPPLVSVREVD